MCHSQTSRQELDGSLLKLSQTCPPHHPPHHYFYSIHRCMHALVSCRPGAGQAQMVVSCITQGCVRALKVCLQGLSNSQWTWPKKHREAERTPSARAKSPFLPPFPPKFTPHNPAPAHQDQSLWETGRGWERWERWERWEDR